MHYVRSSRFPVLSLFSGAGGLDLGFRLEGFDPLLAIDNDPWAVATYNLNLPPVAEIGDLAKLTGADFVRRWKKRNHDVKPIGVIGGPPCQAFSFGNVHPKKRDGRARLVSSFASVVEAMYQEFGIKFFVFENVVGLLRKRYRQRLLQLTQALEPNFQILMIQLNAAHYGVPQIRQRLFVIGLNRERCANAIFLPIPTFAEPRTVRYAIGGLRKPAYFAFGLDSKTFPMHPNHWTMRPRSKKFVSGVLRKKKMNGRSFRVLDWDRPSWTVSYGHREIHIHPRGHRRLSVYEAILLQGFPEKYRILGTLSDQFRLVSDAVPPPLAQAIARSLRATLDTKAGAWNHLKTRGRGETSSSIFSLRPTRHAQQIRKSLSR